MGPVTRIIIYIFVCILCIFTGFIGYTLVDLPFVTELITTDPQTTAMIEYRKSEAKTAGVPLEIKREWIPFENIPYLLQRTIVVSEDASFWQHEGFDWYEMRQAIDRNLEEGRVVRGASTITQQTAKNLYLSPRRSWIRKLRETIITYQIENQLSKTRILEIYLNSIEFGPGVFGVASASQYYFARQPNQLTVSQMVRLAAILPNPLGMSPVDPDPELRWRSFEILKRLGTYNIVSQSTYNQARADLNRFFDQSRSQ